MQRASSRIGLIVGTGIALCFLAGPTVTFADLPGWPYKVKIQFSGYDRPEELVNFPALIVFGTNSTGFSYDGVASPDGGDLRFMDADESGFLNHEIEEWTPGSNSYVWVQIPSLTDNTAIWAYWGNTNETVPPASSTNGATWDATFEVVCHFDHTNGVNDLSDSTANNRDGTTGASSNEVGMISCGHGAAGGLIDFANPFYRPDEMTFSTWIYLRGNSEVLRTWGTNPSYNSRQLQVLVRANNTLSGDQKVWTGGFGWGEAHSSWAGDESTPANNWHHIAVQKRGGDQLATVAIFINGVYSSEEQPSSSGFNSRGLPIDPDITASVNGVLDEWRVCNVRRSDTWIWTEWFSVVSNSTFVEFVPWILNMPASDVTSTSATLNGLLVWTSATPTYATVYWGETDAGPDADGWDYANSLGVSGVGPLSANVTPDSQKFYYYRYAASNAFSKGWSLPAAVFMSAGVTVDEKERYAHETGERAGEFVVSRPPSVTNGDITVHYVLSGIASHGNDYQYLPGSVIIVAGATSAVVSVRPVDDNIFAEADETVVLTLAPGAYEIGVPSDATVAIRDNDMPHKWKYAIRVNFSGYDQSVTLTNFPALLVINEGIEGFHYADSGPSQGYDLRFLNATETELLNHEIEEWNTNGDSFVWVQVPELVDSNTFVWAIWGADEFTNAVITSLDGSTWAQDYLAVWHLHNTSGVAATDSAVISSDGILENMEAGDWQPGLVANGLTFDGIDERVTAEMDEPESDVTHELWMRGTAFDRGMLSIETEDGSGNDRRIYITSGSNVGAHVWSAETIVSTNANVADDEWHHVVHMFGNSIGGQKLYIDGIERGSGIKTSSDFDLQTHIRIGYAQQGASHYMLGTMDEVRVSTVCRSPEWIWTTYKNAKYPDTFATFGVVEYWGGTVLELR